MSRLDDVVDKILEATKLEPAVNIARGYPPNTCIYAGSSSKKATEYIIRRDIKEIIKNYIQDN